ncbi:hypothetical protein [Vibrio sp. WXL103]|uniref:hypothetical protein n=1 Tax=Vibrio sp. WXL103 TaxID=3450710 RepID=UPI003EC7D8EB
MTNYLLDLFYCFRSRLSQRRIWQVVLTIPLIITALTLLSSQMAHGTDAKQSTDPCTAQLPVTDPQYQGRLIQSQLAALYQNNPDFQSALISHPGQLTDGLFGPLTHQWLITFCHHFSINSYYLSEQNFVEFALNELDRAVKINVAFPKWREYLNADQLLSLKGIKLLSQLAPQVLTDLQHTRQDSESPTAEYYYQITSDDLNRQQTLDAISKLAAQQFTDRSTLYNQLSALINALDTQLQASLDLDQYIQSHSLPHAIESNNQTQATSTTQQSPSEPNSDPTTASSDDSSDSSSKNDNSQDDQDTNPPTVTETKTTSKTQTTAPLVHWQLASEQLFEALERHKILALPADLNPNLKPIIDKPFASQYLFESALTLQGVNTESPEISDIFKIAYKKGVATDPSSPINWQATPGCGCQDSQRSIFNDANFYGFFPYWLDGEQPQIINFSQLDRIGLFAAVIKPTQANSSLVLPANWQSTSGHSQFVKTAHRYRSKVDLVVTTPRDLDTLSLMELLDQQLIDELVEAIAQPLDASIVNRMKPWMTLGITPVPTLGDGITLDIDLSFLNTPESQQVFFSFVRELKRALLKREGTHINNGDPLEAEPSDRFFLNIIIPVDEVLANNGDSFYQFTNLQQLSTLANHLIMRPITSASKDEKSRSKAQQQNAQLQDLHQWLSQQSEQLKVEPMFKKMVPMLVTPHNRDSETELTQLIQLSSWSYRGAAYLPIPLNAFSQQMVSDTFFPQSSSQLPGFASLEAKVSSLMDWVCPNRWLLRAILFLVFIAIISVLLMSVYYYTLRKYLVQTPFVLFCISSLVMLMLVFIADPYFSQLRIAIILGFMAVIVGILLWVRWLTMEQDRP